MKDGQINKKRRLKHLQDQRVTKKVKIIFTNNISFNSFVMTKMIRPLKKQLTGEGVET